MCTRKGKKQTPLELIPGVKKVVVVGESQCGKTTFIRSYQSRHDPGEVYSQNGVRVYPCEFQIHDAYGRAAIYEIPSDPQLPSIQRQTHYDTADVLVYMYAIDSTLSLEMLNDRWLPDVGYSTNVPGVLVGNKRDIRYDPEILERLRQDHEYPVSRNLALMLLEYDNLLTYIECSSNDAEEVDDAFRNIFHFAVHRI